MDGSRPYSPTHPGYHHQVPYSIPPPARHMIAKIRRQGAIRERFRAPIRAAVVLGTAAIMPELGGAQEHIEPAAPRPAIELGVGA